jgi:putative spermidine/putrescine transport system substrate-binding protein
MTKHKKQLILSGTLILLTSIIIFFAVIILNQNKQLNQIEEKQNEITFYTWTGDHYFRDMAENFEEQFQIPVRVVVNNPDVYIRKAMLESELSKGTIDCMLVNSSYQQGQLIKANVLPKHKDYIRTAGFTPLYNTVSGFLYDQNVLKTPPVTWDEFNLWIKQNPEQFGFTAVSGDAGFSFIYSVLKRFNTTEWDSAWEWFRSNKDFMLYTSSDYDSLRLLSSGKLQLASVLEHQMLAALKSGEISTSMRMYVPDFGSLSDVYGIAVPKNAPEGDAASRFIQFLTSNDSIQIMEKKLFVQAVDQSAKEAYLPSPDALSYKQIIDSFTDKVLYY